MNEEWKDIVGHEGAYQVSNLGRVRSLPRKVYDKDNKRQRTFKGKILNYGICSWGYFRVNLSRGGVMKAYFLHRIIAAAFISNPNNLPEVNHKDGNRLNNSIENLEWISHQENIQHAVDTGLRERLYGDTGAFAILTPEQVKAIKRALKLGVPALSLAKEYSVSSGAIYGIKDGRSWRHITVD